MCKEQKAHSTVKTRRASLVQADSLKVTHSPIKSKLLALKLTKICREETSKLLQLNLSSREIKRSLS